MFITLEGTEGCGKSTQAARLAEHLRAGGRDVLLTREPGDTATTQWIRTLLADPGADLDNRTELLLFLADRAEHVATVIGPALAAGRVVICDRYSDSTMAYQGYGRGHDLGWLRRLDRWASRGTCPDLTLWIDIDIATGLRRARARRGDDGDRFEAEPTDFHQRIREGFAALCAEFPSRIVRIDGTASLQDVSAAVVGTVEARMQ